MKRAGDSDKGPGNKQIPARVNDVSGQIVDAAIQVHRTLGLGLLESVYELCLEHELKKGGLALARQVALPVVLRRIRTRSRFAPGPARRRLRDS